MLHARILTGVVARVDHEENADVKILVPCKRVSDPDNANKVKAAPDGSGIVTDGLEFKPNPFDDWAVETALRLTEDASKNERNGEIIVASLGPAETNATIRQFLAMGADRAVLVEADDNALDSFIVARALQKITEREQVDLVVMGKQSADGESGAVAPALAEYLGWPQATGVMTLEVVDGGGIVVGQEADGGVKRSKLTGPSVISVTDRILGPTSVKNGVTPADHTYPESDSGRYASLKGIMQAKKKPIETITLADLDVETTLTSSYGAFATAPARSGETTFVASAAELVEKLRTEAKAL